MKTVLMKCMMEVMMTSKAKDEEADDDIFLELKILQFLATRFLPSGKWEEGIGVCRTGPA